MFLIPEKLHVITMCNATVTNMSCRLALVAFWSFVRLQISTAAAYIAKYQSTTHTFLSTEPYTEAYKSYKIFFSRLLIDF